MTEEPLVDGGERRNYAGWICITAMVLLMMMLTWATTSQQKPGRLEGYEDEQATLKRIMSAESLEKTLATPLSQVQKTNDDLSESLTEPISALVLEADKSPMAAMLYAEMRTYQKQPIPISHLGVLQHSRLPEDQAFFEIYTTSKLTRHQADKLIAKLPNEPFVYEAAKVQALQKAGDKDALVRLVSPTSFIGFGLLIFGGWIFLGLSFVVWLVFMRRQREGKLEPKGIPLDTLTPHDADRLAIRATQIFVSFILMQFLAAGAVLAFDHYSRSHLPISEGEVGAGAGLLTIASVFALQRLAVDGKFIVLEYLGFRLTNLKRDVFLGFLGFIAEFPVAMLLAELSTIALHWLPKGTHPASEALMKNHDLRTVIPILISGSIVAPFWEEIVFRGLLFPGLKTLLGGIMPGVLLSSLLFACVHSQGITLWLPLAFVGATSCFLSYQSRSLVPGMVMHCLHNTAIFVMILLS